MSRMESFYGAFQKSQVQVVPEDSDEYYDWEKTQGKQFVKVRGEIYEFWEVEDIDQNGCGLMVIIPPADDLRYTRFVVTWYNGGADLREVVEAVIERTLK